MTASQKDFSERYEIKELIGRGGMGEVYKAYDRLLEIDVAIKLVRKDLSHDPQMQHNFFREARALLMLREPHIVEAFDFGMTQNDQLYLSMELVKGKSLCDLRESPLPLSCIIDVIRQVLTALAHAHARGVVHRDLKTENILVAVRNDKLFAKVIDFGLAMMPAGCLDDGPENEIFGSPGYIAPEQISTGMMQACPATDIYSVGCMLYELICGALPFQGNTTDDVLRAQMDSKIAPFTWKRQFISVPQSTKTALERIILRALSRKMWMRYLSASEFKRDLDSLTPPQRSLPDDNIIAELKRISPKSSDLGKSTIDFAQKLQAVYAIGAAEGACEPFVNLDDQVMDISVDSDWNSSIGIKAENVCIGRENLVDALNVSARNALLGAGQIIWIKGDFGVGKSFLLQKFSDMWEASNATVMSIACPRLNEDDELASVRQSAGVFWSILDALCGAAGSQAERESRINTRLNKLGYSDENFIATLLDFFSKPPLDQDTSLAPAATLMKSPELLARLFVSAIKRPAIVLIDDIQRCHDAMFDFLFELNKNIENTPVLFVVTYDPTEVNALHPERMRIARNPQFVEEISHAMVMDAFDDYEISRILCSNADLAVTLAERIARHARGNMFYAASSVEQLKHDVRLVRDENGTYDLAPDDFGTLPLPSAVRAYFDYRLNNIGKKLGLRYPLYSEVLLRISVLGPRVEMNEIETYLKVEPDMALVDCWFDAIVCWCDYGVLCIEGDNPRYVQFAQPWIGRAGEYMSSNIKLRELHRLAANAYETYYPQPTCDQMSNLAHHWKSAREPVAFVKSAKLAAAAQRREGNLVKAQKLYRALSKLWNLRQKYAQSCDITHATQWLPIALNYGMNSLELGDKTSISEINAMLTSILPEGTSEISFIIELFAAKTMIVSKNANSPLEILQKLSDKPEIPQRIRSDARLTLAKFLISTGRANSTIPLLEETIRVFYNLGIALDAAESSFILSHLLWRCGDTARARDLESKSYSILESRKEIRKLNELAAIRAYRKCLEYPTEACVAELEAVAQNFINYKDIWHELEMFPIRFSMDLLFSNDEHAQTLIKRIKWINRNYAWMACPPVEGYALILEAFECLNDGLTFEAQHAFDDARSMFDPARDYRILSITFLIRAFLALGEGNEAQAGQYLEIAKDAMPPTPWFDLPFDIMTAMRHNLLGQYDKALKYAKQALENAEALGGRLYESAARIVCVESCIAMRNLLGVREAMTGFIPTTFPNRINTVFDHSLERLHDRLPRLPEAFTEATTPLFTNSNAKPRTPQYHSNASISVNLDPHLQSMKLNL